LLRVREVEKARTILAAAGHMVEVLLDGRLKLTNRTDLEHPEEINCLLVNAGIPPFQLVVEEEELEKYFLRLVGMDGGMENE